MTKSLIPFVSRLPQYKTFDAFTNDWGNVWLDFDKVFSDFNTVLGTHKESYPRFDLIKKGDREYVIRLAVAGFKKEDLTVNLKDGILTVSGASNEKVEENEGWIVRGIAQRQFSRSWKIGDSEVDAVNLKDGILSITVVAPPVVEPETKTLEISVD